MKRIYGTGLGGEQQEKGEKREVPKNRIYAGFGTVPMACDMASLVGRRFKQRF